MGTKFTPIFSAYVLGYREEKLYAYLEENLTVSLSNIS